MGTRPFIIKNPVDKVTPCPKCGNRTHFTGRSEQWGGDVCDVWVVCICGYDPTAENTMERLEDVWGSLDSDNLYDALMCWNDSVKARSAGGSGRHMTIHHNTPPDLG